MNKILRVLQGEAIWPPPVWAMRQAGRSLAAYRRLREKYKDFKRMVKTPEIATEITLMPLSALGVDAAILFSDILVIPEALEYDYEMKTGVGPVLTQRITRAKDIDTLPVVDIDDRLAYVMETLKRVRKNIPPSVALVGFSGAPWTLLAYMIEGQGSKSFPQARRFFYEERKAAQKALLHLRETIIGYLQAQIRAGAQVVQLFDPLAEILPPTLYQKDILPHIHHICQNIHAPLIVFAKGMQTILPAFADLPCEALSIDWHTPILHAKKWMTQLPTHTHIKALQGNFDPAIMYAPEKEIERQIRYVLNTMYGLPYIANVGHGILPDSPQENIQLWVKNIQQYTPTQ